MARLPHDWAESKQVWYCPENVICRKHSCGEHCCAVATYDLNFKWSCNECILFVKGLGIFFRWSGVLQVWSGSSAPGPVLALGHLWFDRVHGFSLVDDSCVIFPTHQSTPQTFTGSLVQLLMWNIFSPVCGRVFGGCRVYPCASSDRHQSRDEWQVYAIIARNPLVYGKFVDLVWFLEFASKYIYFTFCLTLYNTLLPNKNKQQISGKIWTPLTSTSFHWVKLTAEIVKFLDASFFF